MREPHLDLLALMSRLLEALGASNRPGNVSGALMDVARDLARWFLWAALRFEWANVAVELAGAIQKRRVRGLTARAQVGLLSVA